MVGKPFFPALPRLLHLQGCYAKTHAEQTVFTAYSWKSELSDEEILEKLLALNLEKAK